MDNSIIKDLIKYSVAFLFTAIGIMGELVLISTYQVDQRAFSQTLSDLGAFGGFLSGIAAIIAAGAAAIGVTSWLKQLKFGKYLVCIWDVQVALRKVHAKQIMWYAYKYQARKNTTELVKKSEEELEESFNNLKEVCHSLDSIVVRKDFLWSAHISTLYNAWSKIKVHLEKHPMPAERQTITDEFLTLAPLNTNFYNSIKFC